MEKDKAKAAKRAEKEATAATAKAVKQKAKVEQAALKAADKADKAATAKADKAAAKAAKLVEKQTAKDFAAAKLADEVLLGWPDAEVQRHWYEDSIGDYVLGRRQSREPIDESNAVTCRALWWWIKAMQHTKATQIKAALQDMKQRLSLADIQLLRTAHPDTLRQSMSAFSATRHTAQTTEHQAKTIAKTAERHAGHIEKEATEAASKVVKMKAKEDATAAKRAAKQAEQAAEEAAATSTKIAQQKADVKHAADEAVAAADKAAKLGAVSKAEFAEHAQLLDASATTIGILWQAECTAADKDAAAKALAVCWLIHRTDATSTKIAQQEADVKHAADEAVAAADKAAKLGADSKAKFAEHAQLLDASATTIGILWQAERTAADKDAAAKALAVCWLIHRTDHS